MTRFTIILENVYRLSVDPHPMPLAVIGGGMMVLGGGLPVEQAGGDRKELESFTNPGANTPYSPML